ncbi:MAG TPA: hypothetical protein VFH58_03410, partial [Acidimicrobiales bacterium]|nr:hypothetical protein [Acidimicrobiales bacterium]
VLEAAAREAAVAVAGTERLGMRQWYVTFVARGLTGPFVTSTEIVQSAGATVAVDTSLTDEGSGRLIASATAIFERSD